ncbi:MAG: lytic murein transglycosylase B [Arenicellales bacterium]|nr:lytic murein transglycosylase B [Arenicellales bacterium]
MVRLFLFVAMGLLHSVTSALDVDEYTEVQVIIDEMVKDHHYDPHYLRGLFAQVELQPKVVEAITRPAERLPWYRYQKIFVTESRIKGGVLFWQENREALHRAEKEYGVPAGVIVAIIGVETGYGVNKGSYNVLESLTTLSLLYPKRSKYFTSELKKFLLLVREEDLEPFSVKGSYAGAIGVPQFMPSSYRAYAIDFNGDGKRDLVHDVEDAIGSVANYLRIHKWITDGPIIDNVQYSEGLDRFVTETLNPSATIATMVEAGLRVDGRHALDTKANVVKFEQEDQSYLYRAAFANFYVITTYNKSLLYAMVVYELSQHISRRLQ